jgi:hypothetical protein
MPVGSTELQSGKTLLFFFCAYALRLGVYTER